MLAQEDAVNDAATIILLLLVSFIIPSLDAIGPSMSLFFSPFVSQSFDNSRKNFRPTAQKTFASFISFKSIILDTYTP